METRASPILDPAAVANAGEAQRAFAKRWSRRPPWPPTTPSGRRVGGGVERELEVGGVLVGGMLLDVDTRPH